MVQLKPLLDTVPQADRDETFLSLFIGPKWRVLHSSDALTPELEQNVDTALQDGDLEQAEKLLDEGLTLLNEKRHGSYLPEDMEVVEYKEGDDRGAFTRDGFDAFHALQQCSGSDIHDSVLLRRLPSFLAEERDLMREFIFLEHLFPDTKYLRMHVRETAERCLKLGRGTTEADRVRSRADYYDYAKFLLAELGHDVSFIHAAMRVAEAIDETMNRSITGLLMSDDVRDWCMVMSHIVFRDTHLKLIRLANSQPLTGEDAQVYTMQLAAEEQALVQPAYDALPGTVCELALGLCGWRRFISSALASLPEYEGSLVNVEDRWRYCMQMLKISGSGDMPSVPTDYADGSRFMGYMSEMQTVLANVEHTTI